MSTGTTSVPSRPAEMLSGRSLEGGWTVGLRSERSPQGTGGNFSCCYHVTNIDGRKGFLKALDFADAFREPDPARHLQVLTEAFNFERDVLAVCRGNAMDRVVTAITDGKVHLPDGVAGGVVQYLIFELADGDIRTHLSKSLNAGLAWRLRCLHNIATGLKQLHGGEIAHQDVKPSNVLIFHEAVAKVGDLGRAARKGAAPPHEQLDCAGDKSYAPPERLYGFEDGEWNSRRLGCDCYLLGSMIVFFFCGVGLSQLIFDEIHWEYHWQLWQGKFEEVLPYVREAFNEVIREFSAEIKSPKLRKELALLVRDLSDPDPRVRGDKTNRGRGANPFNLERYVTRLDLLARRAARGDYNDDE
jgi:serine/threonine protein kinase